LTFKWKNLFSGVKQTTTEGSKRAEDIALMGGELPITLAEILTGKEFLSEKNKSLEPADLLLELLSTKIKGINKLKTLSKLEDGGKFKVKNKTSDTKTSNIDANKSLPKLNDKEIVESGFTKDLNLYKKLAKKPGDVEKISSFIDSSPEFGKYLKDIPGGYKFTKYPKGNNTTGLVFKDGLHNEIAFKKAKLDSRHESHHVPYVTYKKHGNKHVAKNGDLIYTEGNTIVRLNPNGKKAVPIPKEELKRLNIDHPSKHPDVHIAIEDFVKLFNKKGK
jgi:hypothetical protein